MRYIKIQFLQYWQYPFDSFGIFNSPILEIFNYYNILLNFLLKPLINCYNLIYFSFDTLSKLRFYSCLISLLIQFLRKLFNFFLEFRNFRVKTNSYFGIAYIY